MKKKELLIIFLLATLATYLSRSSWEWATFGPHTSKSGWPFKYYYRVTCGVIPLSRECPPGKINVLPSVADVLFWFLVLLTGWWVAKRLIVWYKKDNEKS